MFRIRHQLFYAGLMLAMAAVYSALASINVVAKITRPLRRGG